MSNNRSSSGIPEHLLETITQEVLRKLQEPETSGVIESAGLCQDCTSVGFCASECEEKTSFLAAQGIDRVGGSLGMGPVSKNIAPMIDHTILKPDATEEEILRLCEEARTYRFASVCVQPRYVRLAARALEGSSVAVCTVIGFPHGANETEVKTFETQLALGRGAQEIDMVIPVGAAKSGRWEQVREDIRGVVRAVPPPNLVKVIMEMAFLNESEKRTACQIAKEEGAAYVKTSTGFGPGGATLDDIRLMREVVGPSMGIKAAGGIRDKETAEKMIEAGATRIGASASIKIVSENGDSR